MFGLPSEQTLQTREDKLLQAVARRIADPEKVAIMGWSYMLREGLSDEMTRHATEVIARNARAQKQLVEDLVGHGLPLHGFHATRNAGRRVHPIHLQSRREFLCDVMTTGARSPVRGQTASAPGNHQCT